MAADIKLRWVLDVVDRGAGKALLRNDRNLRRSLEQTDRQYGKTTRSAVGAAARQEQASRRVANATTGEGRAAVRASQEVRRYAAAQREALTISQRLVAQSARVEDAYHRQARAAREAGRAQKTAAAASQGGAAVAGAAGGALARGGALLGVAGTGAAVAGAVKIFAGFEQQIDKVSAVSGASTRQLAGLEQQAKRLGATTNFSNREVAGGMIELATAGFRVKEIMGAIPGTLALAAASGTDLARSAEIQAAALRSFEIPASRAGHVADVLTVAANKSAITLEDLGETMSYVGPVAGRFNQRFEDMAAATAILGNVGIKGSQAGTTLRRGLISVIKPSEKTIAQLDKAGISADKFAKITEDSQGRLRPMPQILGGIADALKGVDGSTRRRTLAQLFGTEALPGLVTLVDKGEASISSMADAMRNSRGEAEKTAAIMRDNVAGAFDQFTGSVETAATTLVEKFAPAIKTGLQGAAGAVSNVAKAAPSAIFGVRAGLQGRELEPKSRIARGPGGRVESVQTQQVSGVAQVGQKIGAAARSIGATAAAAGKQLLDAFKPAMPLLRNVLLPLLTGVGKGVLTSIVAAFKIAIPVIKGVATVLGFIGEKARPLRPVIEGIGTVLGSLFGGPILVGTRRLKGLADIVPKFGIVFRLAAAPIRLVAGGFKLLGAAISRLPGLIGHIPALIGSLPGLLSRLGSRVLSATKGLAVSAAKGLASLPGKLGSIAIRAGRSVAEKFRDPTARTAAIRALTAPVRLLPGALGGLIKNIGGKLAKIGKDIVGAIVNGIRSAPGAIINAIEGIVPGPLKSVLKKAGGVAGAVADLFGARRGGRLHPGGFRRYQQGGLVPAFVSPGEAVVHGGQSWTVPGARTAADNVFAQLPAGAAVLTDDGQQRMAMGASLGQALATQAPHFRAGGIVGAARAARGAGLSGSRLVTAVAVAGPESRYNPRAHALTSREDSRGLWQINVRAHPWAARQNQYDPDVNAGAMKRVSNGGRNWRPWTGFTSGAFRGFLDRARAAVKGSRGGSTSVGDTRGGTSGGGTRSVDRAFGRSRTRGGLLDDAFGSALEAARGGSSPGRHAFTASLAEALAGIETTRSIDVPGASSSRRTSGAGGNPRRSRSRYNFRPGGGWGGTQKLVRHAIRGWTGRASYKRSRVVNGNTDSDHLTSIRNAYAADIAPGSDGMFNTIAQRLGIPARKGSWNKFPNAPLRGFRSQLLWHAPDGSHKDHVHLGIRRMRRGGRVPSFRTGGVLGRSLTAVTQNKGGSLAAFVGTVDEALSSRLEALRRDVLARVRRGGRAQVVARLQAALSAIDETLGRRIGRTLRLVDSDTARSGRAQGALDRQLRRQGTDPSSVAGIGAQVAFADTDAIPTARRNVDRLKRAAAATRKAGQPAKARELEAELLEARDSLDEAVTANIERKRDLLASIAEQVLEQVRAAAQDRSDVASFNVDAAQNSLAGLDLAQRLDRRAETPAALRERASAIQSALLPTLRDAYAAADNQFRELAAIDGPASPGARQAFLAVQQTGNDIASAMADAADLIRQAGLQAAQETVDTAAHGTSMSQLAAQRLELEQRIAGTFEGGAKARADLISSTIIPALEAELAALRGQADAATTAGDPVFARQVAEAIAGKQNEILQATLDATEQVAENTAARAFGGTTGFAFGGETLTDSLIAVGNGS